MTSAHDKNVDLQRRNEEVEAAAASAEARLQEKQREVERLQQQLGGHGDGGQQQQQHHVDLVREIKKLSAANEVLEREKAGLEVAVRDLQVMENEHCLAACLYLQRISL